MANVKISGLPSATTPLTGAELVPVVQGGVTSQTTVENFNYFIQDGIGAIGTTVQAKLRETLNLLDFNVDPTGATDSSSAIQYALNSFGSNGGILYASKGTYLCNSAITIPPNVFICGDGRMATIFTSALTTPLFSITGNTAENYNCGMSELQIQAKNCLTINSGTFDGAKAIVLPRFVRVLFKGTYSASSGDALFQTANVRDNTNAAVSSLSGTNLSVTNTYIDVSSYGIGVFAQAIFDAKFEQCQFVNFGVGVSFNGCDINILDDCRFQANGWHYYEAKTGTYGSQNKITNCDILQNYRAGGVVFNNTNFSRIIDNYFEDNGAWGCYFWLDATQGARIELNRFDDSNYYSTAPAFGITNNIGINNTIQCNDYQLYSYTESPNAVIRNIGFASQDSNHPQLLIYQNNNEYFPKLQNALPGYTVGPIDKKLYAPTNCPFILSGNISPLSVLDTTGGSAYAFYNSSSSNVSTRFDLIDAVQLAYSFQVSARTVLGGTATLSIASPCVVTRTAHGFANGDIVGFSTTGALPTGLTTGTNYYVVNKTNDTFQVSLTSGGAAINTSGSQSGVQSVFAASIFFSVTHTDSNNNLKATLYSSYLTGFNNATYATVSQAITLTASNLTQGDCIYITWVSNAGYLRGVKLI